MVMRILLTNDDGVYALGLASLHQALAAEHDVLVVAPETEQSAVGHAITLADPIRVRTLGPRTGFKGFAITGTPADCVKLAANELLDHSPDLVISGINQGANIGVNLLYSGTVSAATEAALLGLKSFAISLDTLKPWDFSFAARFAAHVAGRFDELGMPAGVPLNINVPALPTEEIKGVRFTRQSQARIKEDFIRRKDPRGHVYYWLGGETMPVEGAEDVDYPALKAGYISITPVRHSMTHERALQSLSQNRLGLPVPD